MKLIPLNDLFVIDTGAIFTLCSTSDKHTIIFDTSLDRDTAKKIDKLFSSPVKKIVNTHSHADHIGGNLFFQEKYNATTYIQKRELSFCFYPEIESSMLYGGASFNKARGKFLCAKKLCNVKPLEKLVEELVEENIKPVEIFGHSPGHTGFLINDIFFAGDGIFSEEVIKKHKILYIFDSEEFVNSLRKIQTVDFEYLLICHKGIFKKGDVEPLVEKNLKHVNDILDHILRILEKHSPLTADEITLQMIEKYEINLTVEYFLLISSTIKGYLKYLENLGKVVTLLEKGLKWKLV